MNRRIVVIIICFVCLCSVLLLSSSLFCVKQARIIYNDNSFLSSSEYKMLLSNNYINYNQSIFQINEEESIKLIEKDFPSIKVNSIERIFPDSINIYIDERMPIFYFLSGSVYFILDSDLKIIDSLYESPNLVQLKNIYSSNYSYSVADNLNDHALSDIPRIILNTLLTCEYSNIDFIANIKRIEISDNKVLMTTQQNTIITTKIEIENYKRNLKEKVIYALSAMNSLTEIEKTHGILSISEKMDDSNSYIITYQN